MTAAPVALAMARVPSRDAMLDQRSVSATPPSHVKLEPDAIKRLCGLSVKVGIIRMDDVNQH